jgi:hypothetical protein
MIGVGDVIEQMTTVEAVIFARSLLHTVALIVAIARVAVEEPVGVQLLRFKSIGELWVDDHFHPAHSLKDINDVCGIIPHHPLR